MMRQSHLIDAPEGKLMEAFVALAECVVVCVATVVAAVVDARRRIIPNACPLVIVITRILAVLALSCVGEDPFGLLGNSLVGTLVVGVPLVAAALATGGVGGGDIKLFAALGFSLGWMRVLVVLFLSCMLTVLVGFVAYLVGLHAKMQSRFLSIAVPMAPQIAVSLIITFWHFPM